MERFRRETGFTLLELLVVIALLGFIAVIAVPAFNSLVSNNRVVAASNQLIGFLGAARADAVQQSQVVRIRPRDGGDDWGSGMVAWIDVNGDGAMQASEIIRQTQGAAHTLEVDGVDVDDVPVGFRPNGLSRSAGDIVFTICSDQTQVGRRVTLHVGGRVSAVDHVCS